MDFLYVNALARCVAELRIDIHTDHFEAETLALRLVKLNCVDSSTGCQFDDALTESVLL